MKNILYLMLFSLLAGALIMSGCKKEPEPFEPTVGMSSSGENLELGVWVDDDTFRISAQGLVKEKHLEKAESIRHEIACTAAKMVAMHKVMNAFLGAETKTITSEKTGENTFSGTIKNGTVVEENFDESSNTCTVVFQVQESNLRKSVEKK